MHLIQPYQLTQPAKRQTSSHEALIGAALRWLDQAYPVKFGEALSERLSEGLTAIFQAEERAELKRLTEAA